MASIGVSTVGFRQESEDVFMSIYIVRPKAMLVNRSIQMASRNLTATSRQAQMDEVFNIRLDDPTDKDIRRWVSESKGVKHVSIAESSTKITGTTILEMTDEKADQMRKELPDTMVLRDQPIELIRPLQPVATAKKKVTKNDLWHLKAIGLEAARLKGFNATGNGVTIAVLDTGIDETHPELVGKVSKACTFDVNTWSNIPINPSIDTDGHGTHVAGLICGMKVGIAPGAKVLSGVMIPQGHGNLSDFILAIEWVGMNPEVQIVNMSAGFPGYLPELRESIAELMAVGILPVIATGNEGRNKTRSPGNYIEVLSVGATNRKNMVSSFSSSGTLVTDNHQYDVPDVVAPGEGIYSSIMGGGYEAWDGTSMATPIVSGVAALILEKHPGITLMDLQEEIFNTCKVLLQPVDRQGHGLVQVKQ